MTPEDGPSEGNTRRVVRYAFECHPDCYDALPTLKAGTEAFGLFWLCAMASAKTEERGVVALTMAERWESGERLALLSTRLISADLWRPIGTGWVMVQPDEHFEFWRFRPIARREAIPERLRAAVYERDGNACVACGSTDDLTVDHIHPWSLGGSDSYPNLQTLCRSCNSSKGARV